MMVVRWCTRAAAVLLAGWMVLWPVAGTAQTAPPVRAWDARAASALDGAEVVLTASEGNARREVARLPRDQVGGLVEMTDRLAQALQMPSPRIQLVAQERESPNAFATFRDGQMLIAVNLALLKLTRDDPAMLASVVGHELGHLKANHPREGSSRASAIGVLGALLGAVVDIDQARRGRSTGGAGMALGALGAGLVNAKFSRDQEREADELGIRAMAQAGYNPQGAAQLWRAMAQASRSGGAGLWFDSHPSHPEREQALTALAAQLQPVYLASARPDAPAALPALALGVADDPYPRSAYATFAPSPAERAAGSAYVRGHDAMLLGQRHEAGPLLQDAARSGDERALTMLADLHASAADGPQDLPAARQLLEQAAARGFGPALRRLGQAALSGTGRPRAAAEGLRLLSYAADRADSRAQAMLGFQLASAQYVARDFVRARGLAQASADAGDPMGKALLGKMLRDGDGGAADPARGLALLQEAAAEETTLSWARYQVGVSYEKGLGTAVDPAQALAHYETAAAAGLADADARVKALRSR